MVTGNDNYGFAGFGDENTAVVIGIDSNATAGDDPFNPTFESNDNNSAVGDSSTATAGPGDNNTAIVTGDGLTAIAGPGDGNTVVVPLQTL